MVLDAKAVIETEFVSQLAQFSSLEQMVRDGEIFPATGWHWQLDQEAAA